MDQDQIDKTLLKINQEANAAKRLLIEYMFNFHHVLANSDQVTEVYTIVEHILTASNLMVDLKLENFRRELERSKKDE